MKTEDKNQTTMIFVVFHVFDTLYPFYTFKRCIDLTNFENLVIHEI